MIEEGRYFVARSWHEGPTCNKWCVWEPSRVLFRVCTDREEANGLAGEMNARPKQLCLFEEER